MSVCRSCGAEIEFALYGSAQGKRTPLDAGEYPPEEDGSMEVVGQHGLASIVRVVPAHERAGRLLRRTHFKTCTEPERWRK